MQADNAVRFTYRVIGSVHRLGFPALSHTPSERRGRATLPPVHSIAALLQQWVTVPELQAYSSGCSGSAFDTAVRSHSLPIPTQGLFTAFCTEHTRTYTGFS